MTFQKNVCYFDLVAMVTIQGLLSAKHGHKLISKTKVVDVHQTWVDNV